MTKRLFEQDVYKIEHVANIIKVIEAKKVTVVLDETIFFPIGGGQAADKGYIDGIEVLDVIEKDGEIHHILASEPENKKVSLKVNWQQRLDQMQQHCGEHILSGVIKSEYDGNNKGFHLGDDYVTVDVDLKEITKEMLDNIEDLANEAIYKNIEIKTDILDSKEKALKYPVRKDLTVDEDIRVVHIPDVDCVACCGTHPNRTGDVGIIKIFKAEKNKGMTRIFFKCGKRALNDLRKKTNIITSLNKIYSSDDNSLIERMNSERDKNEIMKKEYIKLNRKRLDEITLEALIGDNNFINLDFEELSSNDMNYIIKNMSEKKEAVILLYSDSEKKIILSSHEKFDIHCGSIFKVIRSFNGKGGGNKKTAQGVFVTTEDAKLFLEEVIKNIEV